MNRSMISASVTLGQLQHKLDNVANNLANVNTTGYKRRDVSFSDLLVQQMNNVPNRSPHPARLTPMGVRSGTGAAVAGTTLRLEQGTIKQTERMLDIALTEPEYFFQVLHNGATEYTRDGAFYLTEANRQGYLNIVTGDGAHVLGTNGPIEIPANYKNVTIASNGSIEVTLQNDATINAGQLLLANVHNPQYLQAVGNNRFAGPNEPGIALADVLQTVNNVDVVAQGALEMSNVDMATEMTSMIEMQRHFQLGARSLTIADEMMGLVNRIR